MVVVVNRSGPGGVYATDWLARIVHDAAQRPCAHLRYCRREMMRWLFVGVVGCAASEATLRIEPAAIDLDVELDSMAYVNVRVFAMTGSGAVDVTADARLALVDGARLGAVAGTRFTSDGRTGGHATIAASFGDVSVDLPVHVRIHSMRREDGVPLDAAGWFESATDVVVDALLEPGDGAVLPPNLGRFDVDFAAADGDDLHEVALTGPISTCASWRAAPPGRGTSS